MSKQPEQIRPLAPAPGSAATCEWIILKLDRDGWPTKKRGLCGLAATHREPVGGRVYCTKHALQVADMFGNDQIDALPPNVKAEP